MTQARTTPAASSWRHEHQHPSTPASTIRFPNPPPERRITEFCGGHGPGETPGPIPNPEAKPWHGDGTMPERTWESSTPPQPHFTEGPGNTRSPGLRISQATPTRASGRRSPARADNPHRPHRHTGGTYHTARFPSHEHHTKPEEQPQSNIIFPIASSHCHLLTLSSRNAMVNNSRIARRAIEYNYTQYGNR